MSLVLAALLAGCACNDPVDDDPGDGDGPADTVDTDDTEDTDPPIDTDACDGRSDEVFCDGDTLVTCDASGAVAATEDCTVVGICDETAGACVDCAPELTVPYADPVVVDASGIFVAVDPIDGDFETRALKMRPVTLEGRGNLTVTGPLEVFSADGTDWTGGGLVDPGTLLIRATASGTGTVIIEPETGCPGDTQTLQVTASTPRDLAGRALTDHPWVEDWDLYTTLDTITASVDPHVYFDRVGQPFDAYVVEHRDPTDWAADPTLTAVAGPVTGSVAAGDIVDGLLDVWATPPTPAGLYTSYDLVLDFGQDGVLDPGDLIDGFDDLGFAVSGDLTAPGPYTPIQGEISESFWHTMRVYAPAEIAKIGPVPMIAISHGNGHDYTWYDYLGNHLASHGYVVMSHRNDTGPGTIAAAATTWENTEVFLGALATFQGGFLDGNIDTSQIVWVGHSRGGESVGIARHWIETGAVTPANYSAADVVLISSIAPTIFEGPDVVNPHNSRYHLIAGSGDGDVNGGASCSICQYFRIFQRATNERSATYVQGADHNVFNCCGAEDFYWFGAGNVGAPIGRPAAQALAKSIYLAMLESQLRGHEVLGEFMVRAPEGFQPPNIDLVYASQHKRAPGDRKFVVDDFQTNNSPELSSSGELVTYSVRDLVEDPMDDGQDDCGGFGNGIECQLSWTNADPMNGMTQSDNDPDPARGIVFQWDLGDDGLLLEFALASAEADLTDDAYLSFRAAQGTRHPNTNAEIAFASFSVALVDGAGNESALDHRVYGGLTQPWARTGDGNGIGWSNEFQTIRVPLSAFTADGRALDLSDIAAIRFLFGPSWGSEVGRIGLDDIEILGEGVR